MGQVRKPLRRPVGGGEEEGARSYTDKTTKDFSRRESRPRSRAGERNKGNPLQTLDRGRGRTRRTSFLGSGGQSMVIAGNSPFWPSAAQSRRLQRRALQATDSAAINFSHTPPVSTIMLAASVAGDDGLLHVSAEESGGRRRDRPQ